MPKKEEIDKETLRNKYLSEEDIILLRMIKKDKRQKHGTKPIS